MRTTSGLTYSSIGEQINIWKRNVVRLKQRWKLHNGEGGAFEEGIREMKLYHGLKLISSAPLMGNFLAICYRNDTQEYLVLDDALTLARFSIQAKPIQPSLTLSSTMTFTNVIWCEEIQILAGFVPHDDLVWILNSTLKLNQIIRNEFRVENVFYTPYSNEIVVVGPTKVTRFPMEHREQTLNPWKTINMSDVSFGPTWKLDYSSLIESDPQYLKLAGSYSTTLYIIPLTCDKDEDSNVPVKFIAKKANATEALITTLYFHSMSQWTICGDQQGNISTWNLHLECMMNCPSSHNASVQMIIGHPAICGFISSAKDNILQVWSCNLKQKIESFNDLGEVSHIALNPSASSVATLGSKLTCLQMHQLYNFYSPLTAEAVQLFGTTSPTSISHVIARSSDGIVRILSSQSGEQINLYVPPHDCRLVTAVAHSLITNHIYIVDNNGTGVSVVDTNIRPMKITDTWNIKDKSLSCMIVYDYYDKVRTFSHQLSEFSMINPACVRILIGTTTGELISIDEKTGGTESTISAHHGKVTKLHCSMTCCQIISLGVDKCLKIWRMLPDILMPLALLDCVYYENTISDIASLMLTVCVVSSSELSAVHELFMYNTTERKHLEHHPSKDHTKLILAIESLEHLKICVTSSKDATMRIWNDKNDLLRILEINICVEQLAFSSSSGDIVFGAGQHLYRIPYENYLSSKYQQTEIQSNKTGVKKQKIVETVNDVSRNEQLNKMRNEKLLQPVSSVPLGSLDPNVEGPRIDLMLKEQMCMQLKYRDEDILRMKRNDVHAKKTVKMKALLEHNDWERHLNELLVSCSWMNGEISSLYDVLDCRQKYIESEKIDIISSTIKDNVKESLINCKSLMKISHLHRDKFIPNSIYK